MNQAMVTFIRNENQLINDIKNMNSDSRQKDDNITDLKRQLEKLKYELAEKSAIAEEFSNRNEILITKFMVF